MPSHPFHPNIFPSVTCFRQFLTRDVTDPVSLPFTVHKAYISLDSLWYFIFHTNGATSLLHPSPAPYNRTSEAFLIYFECPKFILTISWRPLTPTSHASAMGSNANAIQQENVTKLSNTPTVIKQSEFHKQTYSDILCPTISRFTYTFKTGVIGH